MKSFNVKLNIIKKKLKFSVNDTILFNILFEMYRYFDKMFVAELHKIDKVLNQYERNNLRLYYYYGIKKYLEASRVNDFNCYSATDEDKLNVIEECIKRCEQYNEDKIIKSIEKKYIDISSQNIKNNSNEWLAYYNKKRMLNSDFSLFVLDYTQEEFVKHKYNIKNIFRIIADIYDHLENYRYFIFKLSGRLTDKQNHDITWKVLYKIGIYCENFIQFSEKFSPFKKEEKINQLNDFLNEKFPDNDDNIKIAEAFYSTISTGFKMEDCLISNTQKNIILTFQKIKLDNSNIPCPACLTTIQNGNSYPEMFLRSFECKNPKCSERSKSGRGKRFDDYGTYRYFKLSENKKENDIKDNLYKKWRKDIFSDKNNIYDMLIKYYAWDSENICFTKEISLNSHRRNIIKYKPYSKKIKYNINYEELPIYKLFSSIKQLLPKETGNEKIKSRLNIINGDSTKELANYKKGQIAVAVTSPPYYNAREYSQWQNLIMYLIDMQCNCNAVYNTLKHKGYYFYNIGDIVASDNVYVSSNMSKRRLQLGFLSCMIFEICGFNLIGNIIWDKGEVQSKRNSTINHNSGYIKCINCYEHFLVFKKCSGVFENVSKVKKISPVIKINSKGKNLAEHTAPYPINLVNLVKPYIDKSKFVLDPFLGSGTTLSWCKMNKYKGIGFEINKEYYELSKRNLAETKERK